jgi:hypothetical protein
VALGYAMWGICFSKCSNSAEREDVVTAALLCSCDGLCVWFDDLSSDMNNFFFNLIRPFLGRLTCRAIGYTVLTEDQRARHLHFLKRWIGTQFGQIYYCFEARGYVCTHRPL